MGTEPKEVRRARLVARVGVLAIAVLVTNWTMDHLVLVKGKSIPYRVAWIAGGEIHKGDYVNAMVSHPVIAADGRAELLTKRVACVAGEDLRFDGEQFWCGDEDLGGVIEKTWDGKALTPFQFDGPIPEGKAFVMGEHPRSFDSRYFGLLEVQRMTRVVGIL